MFYDSEAVKMPAAESSISRWQQDVEAQTGSDRANAGAKTNGPMKAVGGPRRDKQRGHSRRPQGFNDRWDQMTKAEQQTNGRSEEHTSELQSLMLISSDVFSLAKKTQ